MNEDLATWLLEQIAEDERLAERAREDESGEWRVRDLTAQGYLEDEMAEHVAQWDPVRVLVECDAKRRIVEYLKPIMDGHYTDDGELVIAEYILPVLAAPYADRPGYREEWRPAP